ncbi:23S rRNA (uracil(1939)-C(5))-methyltransferase RlmD [Fundidesulfovibrio terrae]|uniref:23S rRNA (uracil(1939)-C(5))-methyltransferase RlmD n=1 Tax=Fundidesulfovibrio terrae TaxID=2922866 RepID=UPI001FAF62D7|nr:23S rRNA (uracil(1939)-C(5))-methyltransferase RlmD [Fundidesulfovibrio terrae]
MLTSMSQSLELTIERAVFGGAGLARHDGRIVFVEGGLPGSVVSARITREEKSVLRAVAEQVLTPSPHAAEPFCPHFGVCGGCTWQDASYAAQLDWKRDIVSEQLRRLGGLEAEVAPTVASPEERFYRNKMEFAFGPGQGKILNLGLRERFNPGRVLEVRTCFLMPEPAMDIVDAVRRLTVGLQLPPYFARTGTGAWRHLVLRRSEASGKWLAQLIVGPKTPFKRLRSLGETLMNEFDQLAGVVLDLRRDRSDFAISEARIWAVGEEHLEEELDGLTLRVSAEAFFQTNTRAAALLYAKAVEAARLTGSETVWDLYCGAGGLSLFLARAAKHVTGYEISPAAVEDAQANAQANAVSNCAFVAGDLKDAVARKKSTPDVVVLDPPRAGLHPDTAEALLRLAPARLVYVSCNPSTLARDLGKLARGYDVASVTPVDLFPHTPHIECVAELVRR